MSPGIGLKLPVGSLIQIDGSGLHTYIIVTPNPAAARRYWKEWYGRAIRSRIAPLVRFARNLKAHLATILTHCRWRLSTRLLEVIKRMAYGFRDDEYFFLKVRAALPGTPGRAFF